MDSIPDDLLELQARFDQWQANRKYDREPIPDQSCPICKPLKAGWLQE